MIRATTIWLALIQLVYGINQECTSKYGWKGYCRSSWDCFALGSLISQGYDAELCATNSPIVCCPLQAQPQNNFLQASIPQTSSLSQTPFTFGSSPYVSQQQNYFKNVRPKKRRRYQNAYLKTYIQDGDDNTIVKVTPIRLPQKRRKRKHSSSHSYANLLKSTRQDFYPSDLTVQDDELSFTFEKPEESQSSRMCEEFAAYAWEKIVELSPNSGLIPISQEFCPGDLRDSVVLASELPFMAGLGYEDNDGKIVWACSGTLISREYLLTAAHCLHPPLGRPKVARLGTPNLDARGHGFEVSISEVILNPLYNPSDRSANIALLRLSPVPSMGIRIRPACLQTNASGVLLIPHWVKDPTVTLKLETDEDQVQLTPDSEAVALHKSISVEVNADQCNGTIADGNQLCVETVAADPCQSQSEGGEPLIRTDKYNRCMYTVAGVAVDKACSSNQASLFTDISPYISWIENIVWS